MPGGQRVLELQAPRDVVPFGRLHAHALRFEDALDAIEGLWRAGAGGYVVTPNVDHVVLAERDDALVAAYRASSLALADGMPLVWLSRAMGVALPEKISGSDLVRPLAARAAARGLSVFLLGARPGIAARAAEVLVAEHPGLRVAGVLAPPLGFERDEAESARVVAEVRRAEPALVLVALGAPKQELWMHRHRAALAPAVLLGIGGTLDFIAGAVKRAPPWMSRAGLEWLYRLAQEPRRMASRYLVRDRAFLRIALRAMFAAHTRPRAGAPSRP
jgi:N-acetylglucosaminyldiphosphoundecaprenol N-acetyl-beta-D-mannosaminyltransferase